MIVKNAEKPTKNGDKKITETIFSGAFWWEWDCYGFWILLMPYIKCPRMKSSFAG